MIPRPIQTFVLGFDKTRLNAQFGKQRYISQELQPNSKADLSTKISTSYEDLILSYAA